MRQFQLIFCKDCIYNQHFHSYLLHEMNKFFGNQYNYFESFLIKQFLQKLKLFSFLIHLYNLSFNIKVKKNL